jgi:hypothetical protein
MYVFFHKNGEIADKKPNKGVTIYNPQPIEITIGETTAQDILLDLGAPLRKFVKQDGRMERIWGAETAPPSEHTGSMSYLTSILKKADHAVFWNYFQLGLDILISDNLVSKIILHSNIVCHL